VSISLTRVEIQRALRRAGAGSALIEEARRQLRALGLRAASDEILDRAESLEPKSLRALDALHLACALELQPALDAFLCYDRRLADAARAHGLPVLAPGVDAIHEP
jgi:uncharacterized protein